MSRLERFIQLLDDQGCGEIAETDPAASVVYGTDNSIYQLRPVGAVVPRSIDDLVAIAQANSALERPFDLVARGGGTGTNGQSLTNGIVVDTRRAMHRIVSIDVDARRAVVEPGVVLGQLNAALEPSGLYFAPHVSTSTRATIGGMVATDAAGKGSLVHGRTNRHVVSIEAVLSDGTSLTFEHLSPGELADRCADPDRVGELYRTVSDIVDDTDAAAFPDIPRGFSGYNLVGAGDRPGLDMTKILAGSEGTLAMIGRIEIALTPLAAERHLAVVAYDSFADALRDSNRLTATTPAAVECLDEHTISLAGASPAFPRLAALFGTEIERRSLLLIEFDEADGITRLLDALDDVRDGGVLHTAVATTADPSDIAAVWKVRADAVGLLGQAVGGRRSVAFVEDCAVAPDRLDDFVAEYRSILDGYGLTYGMFGHADVGCIHVRPALDLYDEQHEKMLRAISDDVAGLVARFGGVLWGEHGRGFRGEYLDLDDETVSQMRRVKTAFDPHNSMNPGKLYTPLDVPVGVTRIDEVPLRVHRDKQIADAHRHEFESAFSCNGNGICHHWGDSEVMCPSFKATLDPRLSPKGRADLLREWLRTPDDVALVDALDDSMQQCLSCGACTGRCPVQVDIPEMKSRFLEQHPERGRRRRLRQALVSRFELLVPIVQRWASITGPLQQVGAPVLERATGVVDLPRIPGGTLQARLAALDVAMLDESTPIGDATLVIVPDAFTAYIEPEVLMSTIAVLRALGEQPAVSTFVPSGKYDHVHGRRRRFTRAVAAQRRSIELHSGHGVPLVVIEPAISLLGAHEYTSIDPDFPHAAILSLTDFLAPLLANLAPRSHGGVAQLFGHCTEVSIAPERMATYRAMLEAAGFDVSVEATTCCGMAGAFGYEAEHQAMSRSLFDTGWRPKLDAPGASISCVSGSSCRSQAARFGHTMVHPIQVLAEALCE